MLSRQLSIALLAIVLASSASAGTVMRFEERTTDAGPATSGTAWIEKDRLKVETGNDSVVFREDKGLVWAWSAGAKTYTELTKAQAEQLGAAMAEMQKQLAGMSPEERAMVEKAMGSRMPALQGQAGAGKPAPAPMVYKPLGRTETINGWTCAGYVAQRGDESMGEYWAASWDQFGITSSDFAVFERLMLFMKEAVGPYASMVDSTYAHSYGEGGLPGVPVRAITSGPTGKSIHEIKKLGHEDIAASTFELPAGLKKQDMGAPGMR